MTKATAIVSKNTNGPSLVQGHIYEVIEITNSDYRIVDEKGDPPLYPKTYFSDDDIQPPREWIFNDLGDGEYSYLRQEFKAPFLFEDLSNGKQDVVETYSRFREAL